VKGEWGGVLVLDGYKRLGHSHPARDIDPNAVDQWGKDHARGNGSMKLDELIKSSTSRAAIMPSASDFHATFLQNVDRHIVHVAFRIDAKTQEVFNPSTQPKNAPPGLPLAFVIDKSLFKLSNGQYKGVLIATAGGTEVWRGDFEALALDSPFPPDIKPKTDKRKEEAIAALAKIPVAKLRAFSPTPGKIQAPAKPLERDTYYVSSSDADAMIKLLVVFAPEVTVRDYKKGFIVRREPAEWYFERREGALMAEHAVPVTKDSPTNSQVPGTKKPASQDTPGTAIGLPAPNASTVEVHGFRGVRTVDGKYVKQPKDKPVPADQLLSKDEAARVNQITASVPLLWAGHIGVSLDGGSSIWGFTPSNKPGVTKEAFMQGLRENKSFPGLVKDDKYVFDLATYYSQAAKWNTEVFVATQLVDADQKKKIEAQIGTMAKNDGKGDKDGHGKKYQFPYPEQKDGSNFEDKDTANCAIFPTMVDIPVPENTGILDTYMPALQAWAAEGPIDKKGGKVGGS